MSRSLETNILQFKMYMYIFIIKWNHQIVLHPHFSLTALLHIIHVQYLRPLTLVSVEQESYNSTVVSVFFFWKETAPLLQRKDSYTGTPAMSPCQDVRTIITSQMRSINVRNGPSLSVKYLVYFISVKCTTNALKKLSYMKL